MRYPITNTGSKQEVEEFWKIDQSFGQQTAYGFHEGIDWNLKTGGDTDLGQELKSIAPGKIVYYHNSSHPSINFGRHLVVRIEGAWGVRWVHYAHCLNTDFHGSLQDVTEGQVIARLGKSGTPWAHLHFAIFKADPGSIGGIDSIATNRERLDAIWEDPVAFIDRWMQTPTSPVTDQSKYDFGEGFGIIELQQARSIMQAQRMDVRRLKLRLTDGATSLRNLASQFES